MATGTIHRFPEKSDDGSIEGRRRVKDSDGKIEEITEIIFSSDSPTITANFTDEINNLIVSGEIEIPGADVVNSHIVDISDQLEEAKYEYNFVDKDGAPVECGKIFRIFFNGMNVTEDVDISEDRLSFTFINLYGDAVFGSDNTRLVIDFIGE